MKIKYLVVGISLIALLTYAVSTAAGEFDSKLISSNDYARASVVVSEKNKPVLNKDGVTVFLAVVEQLQEWEKFPKGMMTLNVVAVDCGKMVGKALVHQIVRSEGKESEVIRTYDKIVEEMNKMTPIQFKPGTFLFTTSEFACSLTVGNKDTIPPYGTSVGKGISI